MQFDFTNSFEDLAAAAREKHQIIYDRWSALDIELAKLRNDAKGHSNFHLDSNWDLILRCIEDEQLKFIEKFGSKRDGGALFLQISLSKMWLFSTYELLRATAGSSSCSTGEIGRNYCKEQNCDRCDVLRTKQELAFFRVPLAKYESQSNSGAEQQGIHPRLVIKSSDGSIGWRIENHKSKMGNSTLSRLELSNLVLDSLTPSA
jgi:hypothetical protein